jgi:hypothetical protein
MRTTRRNQRGTKDGAGVRCHSSVVIT